MINFIQPFAFDLNIGRAYNQACKPLKGWICIMDQDTLKFEGFAQRVKEITDNADQSQVITAVTNRLRSDNENIIEGLYNEADINVHHEIFNLLWEKHGAKLERTKMPIAGMLMLFHKSVWDQVKFTENAINYDSLFTHHCKQAGFTTHVAKGLYVFHLYRWGRDVGCIDHLIQTEEMKLEILLLSLGKDKIMKVKKDFFCIQTQKAWKKGQKYTGKRKDLAHVVVYDKEKVEHVEKKEKVEKTNKTK